MENKAKFPEYTFMHAKATAHELYPIKMSENAFIEKAYLTWQDLPDRHVRPHVYIAKVDMENTIEIPENVEYIKAVTSPYYVRNNIYGRNFYYYNNRSFLFDSFFNNVEWEAYRIDKSLEDRFGTNITFELTGENVMTFPQGDFHGMYVAVLYKGLLVDDNCDPLLYKNERNAIAANVAYMDARYNALIGDVNAANSLQLLKAEAEIAMAKGGIAEKVTENEIDQMLNVAVSSDRKVHNMNYKFRH